MASSCHSGRYERNTSYCGPCHCSLLSIRRLWLNVTAGTCCGFGCARKFACCDLICCTCSGSGFFAAPAPLTCLPAGEAGAGGAGVAAVVGVACGGAFAFAGVFTPFLRSSACCLAPGFGAPAGCSETSGPRAGAVADSGLAGVFRPFAAPGSAVTPRSVVAPRSFIAPGCFAGFSWGLAAFGPGFASVAPAFSGGRLPFAGDCCSTGCCANAAPDSASKQPINTLVSFFIIIMFSRRMCAIYSCAGGAFIGPSSCTSQLPLVFACLIFASALYLPTPGIVNEIAIAIGAWRDFGVALIHALRECLLWTWP